MRLVHHRILEPHHFHWLVYRLAPKRFALVHVTIEGGTAFAYWQCRNYYCERLYLPSEGWEVGVEAALNAYRLATLLPKNNLNAPGTWRTKREAIADIDESIRAIEEYESDPPSYSNRA